MLNKHVSKNILLITVHLQFFHIRNTYIYVFSLEIYCQSSPCFSPCFECIYILFNNNKRKYKRMHAENIESILFSYQLLNLFSSFIFVTAFTLCCSFIYLFYFAEF